MSAVRQHTFETTDVSRTCQILILCEDFAAYRRAADCCWRIIVQLADDLDFTFNCWNFYELTDSQSAPAVQQAAKTSDIIMLSLHNPELPLVAENCLDSFIGQRLHAEGVLALVLNEPPGSPAAITQLVKRLEQHAQKLGMDFLSLAPVPEQTAVRNFTLATVGDFGERNTDHWGLNE